MPTVSILSFWSNPIASSHAYLSRLTKVQVAELTFALTTTPYYLYFWIKNDLLAMQLTAALFMLISSLLTIMRIRVERLQRSVAAQGVNVFLSLLVIWLTLAVMLPNVE